ncbi:hypothetical protein pb186bvf_017804 [Paramecium bursaria]
MSVFLIIFYLKILVNIIIIMYNKNNSINKLIQVLNVDQATNSFPQCTQAELDLIKKLLDYQSNRKVHQYYFKLYFEILLLINEELWKQNLLLQQLIKIKGIIKKFQTLCQNLYLKNFLNNYKQLINYPRNLNSWPDEKVKQIEQSFILYNQFKIKDIRDQKLEKQQQYNFITDYDRYIMKATQYFKEVQKQFGDQDKQIRDQQILAYVKELINKYAILRILTAIQYYNSNEYHKSIIILEQVLMVHKSYGALAALGKVLINQQNFVTRKHKITKNQLIFMIKLQKQSKPRTFITKKVDFLLYEGICLTFLQQFIEAIKMFDRAIEIGGQQAKFYFKKGITLGKLNLFQEEIKMYDQAISIDSKHINSYVGKGEVLVKLNLFEEAIKVYEQAIQIDHKNIQSLYNKGIKFKNEQGVVLGKLNKFQEEIKMYDLQYKQILNILVLIIIKVLRLKIQINIKRLQTCLIKQYKLTLILFIHFQIKVPSIFYNQIGILLGMLNQTHEEIKMYDIGIKADPKNINFYYNKGVALLKINQFQESIKMFDLALKIDPMHVDSLYNKGETEINQKKGVTLIQFNQLDKSIKIFQQALQIDPTHVLNRIIIKVQNHPLKETYLFINLNFKMQQKCMKKRYNSTNIIFSRQQIKVYIIFRQGVAHEKLNQYQEAIGMYDKVLNIDPKNVDSYFNKGVALGGLNKFQEEIEMYDKAISIDPKHIQSYFNKGYALGKQKQFNEEINMYNKTLEMDPRHVDSYFNKGIAFESLNQLQESIKMHDIVIQMNNKHINSYFRKGNCLLRLNQFQDAIRMYDKVIQLNPQHIDSYLNKGTCLNMLKQYREALCVFDQILQHYPKHIALMINKGYALGGLNQFEDQIHLYKEVLKIQPNNFHALFNLGSCFINLNQFNEAIQMFNNVLLLEPNHIEALYKKGIKQILYQADVLSDLGQFQLSNQILDKVIQIDPKNDDAYDLKGYNFIKLNEFWLAVNMFDKSLEINPNFHSSKINREIQTTWRETDNIIQLLLYYQ